MDKFDLVDNTITDTVSSIKWAPNSNMLAASSWDGKIRIWEVIENYSGIFTSHPKISADLLEPILQISWHPGGGNIFAGCVDGTIKIWDLEKNTIMNGGQLPEGVASVHWCNEMNVLFAISWDKSLTVWDFKQPTPVMRTVMTYKVKMYKIQPHYMSIEFPIMVIAMAGKKMSVFDLKRFNSANPQPIIVFLYPLSIQTEDSRLNYNTRSLAAFPNGWISGSIEGRCEIRTLDIMNPMSNLDNDKLNYCFKSHRDQGIYPVNCIAYNPVYDCLATGGGDGQFHIWNKNNKTKNSKFPNTKSLSSNKSYSYSTIPPVVACAFNTQGNVLTVAFGYDWAKGVTEYEEYKNEIFVHKCTEVQLGIK